MVRVMVLMHRNRLFEFAANYFDLSQFANGETKEALRRVFDKRAGKGSRGGEERARKKAKVH